MWKKENDWFWEGNIQGKIARHFESIGYKVITSDTLSKEQGIDIIARRDNKEVLVEVKGYPSDKYADGAKQGQAKKRIRRSKQSIGFLRF